MGGLEWSHVELHWSAAIADASPEILQAIIEVDDLLLAQPMIGYPLSIRNLIDAQPGEGPPEDRLSMLALILLPAMLACYAPTARAEPLTCVVRSRPGGPAQSR